MFFQLLRIEIVLAVDLQQFGLADERASTQVGSFEGVDLLLVQLELFVECRTVSFGELSSHSKSNIYQFNLRCLRPVSDTYSGSSLLLF